MCACTWSLCLDGRACERSLFFCFVAQLVCLTCMSPLMLAPNIVRIVEVESIFCALLIVQV